MGSHDSKVLVDFSRFFVIAGPCVIESEKVLFATAEVLAEVSAELSLPMVFKSSYDKANRLNVKSYRGQGMNKGLKLLASVRRRFNLPIITDVHSVKEAKTVGDIVDVIQIPALLCRQTDLVIAAARTGRYVNIKKGQFLAPWDMKNIVEKAESTGNKRILLTERGSSFGYNNLVSDMRSIPIMKKFGYPVVFDATHTAQIPGGRGTSSGGQREMIPVLAKAAVAAGADGIFMEVHPNPDKAPCDGPNMLALSAIRPLLQKLIGIHRASC